MDDDSRLQALMEILGYGNMPKVVKKRALFEICKMVGVRFSDTELESIEATFSRLEKKATGQESEVRCPFCYAIVVSIPSSEICGEEARSLKRSYVKHIDTCSALKRVISKYVSTAIKGSNKEGHAEP